MASLRSRRTGDRGSPESFRRTLLCLAPFLVPRPRRRRGGQRRDELLGGGSDLRDRLVEHGLVGARLLRRAAQLADELQGRGADFIAGRRGFEVREGLDVAAHGSILSTRRYD